MSELRQREPRVRDERYLRFIRSLPCCICGGINTEAAHLRIGSINYGKRDTGMGEKSSDKWALPLCNAHHREQHATGDELKFWANYSINPFELAISLKAEKVPT
jgi:hypothetical protein